MKKTAVIAAALFAGLGAAGCAQGTQAVAPASSVALAADGHALYQQIFDDVWGTRTERLAAERAVNDKWQSDLAACMTAAGALYVKGPEARQTGGNQAPGDLDVMAELAPDGFGLAAASRYAAGIVDADTADPTWRAMTEAQRETHGVAGSKCFKQVEGPAKMGPAEAQPLKNELISMFTRIQQLPAVKTALRGYGTCMATEAGIKTTSYLTTHQAITEKFPDASVGWAVLSRNGKYLEAVAFEKKVAVADAICRRPVVDAAMAAALPQLQAFQSAKAATIAAVNARWASYPNANWAKAVD